MTDAPWSPAAFEKRFAANSDPWGFATSPYEQMRYAAIMAALRRPRYRRVFEPGCAIGELTAHLATRCEHLLATDVSPTALARAQTRCNAPHVELRQADLRAQHPAAGVDLIVLSEVGYYFTRAELAQIVRRLIARLEPDGELVGCHWLGHSEDHRLHGNEVHAVLDEQPRLKKVYAKRHEKFRLDIWIPRETPDVR